MDTIGKQSKGLIMPCQSKYYFLIKMLILCVAITLGIPATPVHSTQLATPSSDLAVTVTEFSENSDGELQEQEYIGMVDTTTLEVTKLYEDANAVYLWPLSWSPDGTLLAVLRVHDELALDEDGDPMMNSGRTSICIIRETGILQTCLETLPRPYWYTAPRYADNDFYTSWSADSRYLYYMSESGETLSLIEADTTTGQTQRVVFETNSTTEDDLYNIMVWSPDLNYIATGVAFPDVTGDVINLSTGESFALSGIVKPWNIHPEPMPENGGYICQSFSNSGYLSAIDESIPALIIFEPDLSIYVTIDEFDVVSPAFLSCPVWGNEDIYFKIDDREEPEAIFYRYSLTDQAFDARFVNVVFGSSFTISPDETQAAWAYYFDVRLVDLESGETQIIEDYPDHNYSHPIWKPSRP